MVMSAGEQARFREMINTVTFNSNDYSLPASIREEIFDVTPSIANVLAHDNTPDDIKNNRLVAIMDLILVHRYALAVRTAEEHVHEQVKRFLRRSGNLRALVMHMREQRRIGNTQIINPRRRLFVYDDDEDTAIENMSALQAAGEIMQYYQMDLESAETARQVAAREGASRDASVEAAQLQNILANIWSEEAKDITSSVRLIQMHAHSVFSHMRSVRVRPWILQIQYAVNNLRAHRPPFALVHEIIAFRVKHDTVMDSVVIGSRETDYDNDDFPIKSVFETYGSAISSSDHLKTLVLTVSQAAAEKLMNAERLLYDSSSSSSSTAEPDEDALDDAEHVVAVFVSEMFVPIMRGIANNRSLETVIVLSLSAVGGVAPYFMHTDKLTVLHNMNMMAVLRELYDSTRHGDVRPPLVFENLAPASETEMHAKRIVDNSELPGLRWVDVQEAFADGNLIDTRERAVVGIVYDYAHDGGGYDVDDDEKGGIEKLAAAFVNDASVTVIVTDDDPTYFTPFDEDSMEDAVTMDETANMSLSYVLRGVEYQSIAAQHQQPQNAGDASSSSSSAQGGRVTSGRAVEALAYRTNGVYDNAMLSRERAIIRSYRHALERPPDNRPRFWKNDMFVNGFYEIGYIADTRSLNHFEVGSLQAMGGYAFFYPYEMTLPLTLAESFHARYSRMLQNRSRESLTVIAQVGNQPFDRHGNGHELWSHFSHHAVEIYHNRGITDVSFISKSLSPMSMVPLASVPASNVMNLLYNRRHRFEFFHFDCNLARSNHTANLQALGLLRSLINDHPAIVRLRLLIRAEVFAKDEVLSFVMDMASHPSLKVTQIVFAVPHTVPIEPLATADETVPGVANDAGVDVKSRRKNENIVAAAKSALSGMPVGGYRSVSVKVMRFMDSVHMPQLFDVPNYQFKFEKIRSFQAMIADAIGEQQMEELHERYNLRRRAFAKRT